MFSREQLPAFVIPGTYEWAEYHDEICNCQDGNLVRQRLLAEELKALEEDLQQRRPDRYSSGDHYNPIDPSDNSSPHPDYSPTQPGPATPDLPDLRESAGSPDDSPPIHLLPPLPPSPAAVETSPPALRKALNELTLQDLEDYTKGVPQENHVKEALSYFDIPIRHSGDIKDPRYWAELSRQVSIAITHPDPEVREQQSKLGKIAKVTREALKRLREYRPFPCGPPPARGEPVLAPWSTDNLPKEWDLTGISPSWIQPVPTYQGPSETWSNYDAAGPCAWHQTAVHNPQNSPPWNQADNQYRPAEYTTADAPINAFAHLLKEDKRRHSEWYR